MSFDLPTTICFRVTRYCNARCGFCLAPPNGAHPDGDTLAHRIDWLLSRGVRTVHFCGGEPTIHRALPQLLAQAHARGAKTKLTTNGITVPEALPQVLRATATEVKVSLHGDREQHDRIVGRAAAFDNTTRNLRRLLDAGISTSVQTTVVANGAWVVEWAADFCLGEGVRRLSILPFIPRGSGYSRRVEYGLSCTERSMLRGHVKSRRRALAGRLDLRWLDFTARPTHVVEADGRFVLEGPTETMDRVICAIPEETKIPLAAASPGA